MITLERKKIVCHIVVAGTADLVMLHRWAGANLLHGSAVSGWGRVSRPAALFSVMINRVLVLRRCLVVVTALAKSLPVTLVPEETRVSSVWLPVVNDCCFDVASLLGTLFTQWVCLQEAPALLPPPAAVATLSSRPYFLRVQQPVYVTVLGTGRDQRCAPRVLAWNIWFHRHDLVLP